VTSSHPPFSRHPHPCQSPRPISLAVRPAWWLGLLGALLLTLSPAAEAGDNPSDEVAAWRDASVNLFHRSHHTLAALSDEPATRTRFTRLGEALTLLNLQPKTSGNIDRAATLLEHLRAEDDADEAGISAAYHLARIAQWHCEPRRPADALAQYDVLAERFPGHRLGQLAVIKALVIRLYEPVAPEEARRRLAAAGRLEPRLRDPALRSEYHQVLAMAGARFGMDPVWRLPHLLAAEQLGVMRFNESKDFVLATAETARSCAEREIALKYYERFLAVAPRDERTAYVRQRYEAFRDGKELP
jgi:hypothetical protein